MSTSSRPRVPDGLRDLMKDLTREILKEKPNDIYDFAGNYFQTRLPQKEDYAVRDFEPNTKRYDFSYIQNPQRYQVPVALVYSIVPEGLTNLIKDLIKAILREQPQNLCDFAVEYFRHLKTATQEVETKEISYKAYDNYFTNKERFLFTPYVKCTCGRTFGEGYGSSNYQLDNLSTIQHIHRNDSSYKTETITTRLEDTNNNHVKAEQANDSNFEQSEKYMNAIYVIQRYIRRYLKRTKRNNMTTSTHTTTQNNCMNEETAAIIIQRTLRNFFGRDEKALGKHLVPQNNEIVSGVPHLQMNHNENDNISEAASYTSASTALLSASESGRETSDMSTSENILREIIVESEEIENENISNLLTRAEVTPKEGVTFVDGKEGTQELETTVTNQESAQPLEKQNTVSNMDMDALMRIDFKEGESNVNGANKNHNNEDGQQKEENNTNSLNNITSNDTKNCNEHQMETENKKILQYKQIGSSLESGYNTEVEKDKAEISNHKLNNETVLENPENASMVKNSTEFTNKIDEAHEEGYDFEQQKLDSCHESLDDEAHDSILKLNQEIIESCDEIQRKNLTNSIDENSNEYSKENDINTEVSLVKEADVENQGNVIDRSMEKLYEKTKNALEENESHAKSIEDSNDEKRLINNEHIISSQSKGNLNEPETNLVMQELLPPNENKKGTTTIKNTNGDGVVGGKNNLKKSTKQTIESAEFLLKSDSEKQNESDSLINEMNSSEIPLETDSSKEKEEDSNLLGLKDTTKNSSKPELEFVEKDNNLNDSNTNQTETKIIKDLDNKHDFVDESNEKIKNQDDNNIVMEKLGALQQLPNKSIDMDTKKDSSNNNFVIESNQSNNKGNVGVDNAETELSANSLMATKSENHAEPILNNMEQQSKPTANELNPEDSEKHVKPDQNNEKPTEKSAESSNEHELLQAIQPQDTNQTTDYIKMNLDEDEKNSIPKSSDEDITEISNDDINKKSISNEATIRKEDELQSDNQNESDSQDQKLDKLNDVDITKLRKTSDMETETSKDNKNKSITNEPKIMEEKLMKPSDQKGVREKELDKDTDSSQDDDNNKNISNEDPIVKEDVLQSDKQNASDSHEQMDIKLKELEKLNNETSKTEENNKSIPYEATIMKGKEQQPNDKKDSDSREQTDKKDKEDKLGQLNEEDVTTETNKDYTNNKNIYNQAIVKEEENQQPDNQKESNSREKRDIKDKELNVLNDADKTISCTATESIKDDTNNKNISNDGSLMKGKELQPDNQNESQSREPIDKELGTLNDDDTTLLRTATETSKDDKNNKNNSNEDSLVKGEELQPDNQKESDSREQVKIKDKELDKLNDDDATETSKDDKNNKNISNEVNIIEGKNQQTDNQKESDSGEQIDTKNKELNKLRNDDTTSSLPTTETNKDDKNNTNISNETTINEGENQQPDNQKESGSREKRDIKDKELNKLNDADKTCTATEPSKDDTNYKNISNEGSLMKGKKLQPDNQNESQSQEPIDKELGKLNDDDTTLSRTATETRKDDTNNKNISNEDSLIKGEDNQNESDSREQLNNKEKELDKLNYGDATETSKDDKNNKNKSNEHTLMKEEELQPDNQKESQSPEQIDTKDKELDKLNDDDISPRTATETSKDDTNYKNMSNEGTLMKEEELQADNPKESDSQEQVDIRDKELEPTRKLNDTAPSSTTTETSMDNKNNKNISNEATIIEGQNQQQDNQKESDSREKSDIKDKELNDADNTISCTATEPSKDDTNNINISNEGSLMKEKELQPDNQNESQSQEAKDKDLGKLNDNETTPSRTVTETSKDDKNNKNISNEDSIIKVEELQPDNQKELDSREQIDIMDKELDKQDDENTTETSKDDKHNKYNSTIIEGENQQTDNKKESESREQIDTKDKELDNLNNDDITTSRSATESSKDDKNSENISNEATIFERENQLSDIQIESGSREQIDIKNIELEKRTDEDTKTTTVSKNSNDDKTNNSVTTEATNFNAVKLQSDDQKESNSLDQSDMTKSKNQNISSIENNLNSDKFIKQEAFVDDLNINKDLIFPNQIEIQETQNNENTVKESDPKNKEAQENQQKPNIDTNKVAVLESGEQMENKSIVNDEFEIDKQEASEASSSVCGTELEKHKLKSTKNISNEDDGTKYEQISPLLKTDQPEKLENKSLESNKENSLQKQDDLKEQELNKNTNVNEVVDLKGEKLDIKNNEQSVSDLKDSGVLKNEENKNTQDESQTTEIINKPLHEIFNKETSVTKSYIDESDKDHQNKGVLNSTDYEQLDTTGDNKKEENKTEIEKSNAITDNKKPDPTIDQTHNKDNAKATSIENIRDVDEEHLEMKDNIVESNKTNINNLGAQSENSNDDNVAILNIETSEGNIPNSPEMQSVQDNKKLDNNESKENVNKNSETEIDDTVHRILTERLKELRIQNEQNVLKKHHSVINKDSSLENDSKQHEQNEQKDSDVNSSIKPVTTNILHSHNQEAVESETYLLEKMGDKNEDSNISPNEPKIEQDHSENVNRIRRSLSRNEEENVKPNVENVDSFDNDKKEHSENEGKMSHNEISVNRTELKTHQHNFENNSVDQPENEENVVGSEHENDQETTHDNIGNKSPETLIGNQNLNIGRIRNYNEGLIESISGHRFAETHLKSFWKEYQMNNGKPLDQYDCGGNEKVSKIKDPALTGNDNSEMINLKPKEINEYVLIKTESNGLNEVKHLNLVDSLENQENYPVESSNNQNISQGIEDSNAYYNDINHNKDKERMPKYFQGSIPMVAKHYLLEKRKAVKEPTSFTIPFEKSNKLKNNGKPSPIKADSPKNTTNEEKHLETEQMISNKEINLVCCADVEPLLDSETPTKLFNELNEFDYDETHDIDLEITYTIDEILRLKTEHDSQKNSDEESEIEINECSPIIIRLTDKNEAQPLADDSEENIIDPSEFSPTPESMLHTIVELSECETPRPESKAMISSPALLQRNDEDFLTNLEKISNSTSTSWTTGSKEGEDYSFVSDEYLEDENYHKEDEKSPTKTVTNDTQGGIYEYTQGKTSDEVTNEEEVTNEYENLIKQAPSPPTVDPFYEETIEKAANTIQTAYREHLRRKKDVSTENNEYSDEIINGKRSILMAVYTIQRAFRRYRLRKNHTVHNDADTIRIAQPELATTIDEDEYSKEIAQAGQTFLNAVFIIQRAFRQYKFRKDHMNENYTAVNTHEFKQLADDSKNNMSAIVIQKAFRHYLDHKVIMNNEEGSNGNSKNNSENRADNNIKDDKNDNDDPIMPVNLQLTENIRMKEIPKGKDEIDNTIIKTKQNSIANDEECIKNLMYVSQNTTDSQKNLNASKNENIIKLNMLIGQFIDSERQYSDAVNQQFTKFEEPQNLLKSSIDLAEPIVNHLVSRTDFGGDTNPNNEVVEIIKSTQSQIDVNNENYIFENPTPSNTIKSANDYKNDLVENLVDNPSTDTIENVNENNETEKNKNIENQSSETVDEGNDFVTGNEVDTLVQTYSDALETPRLRSKEASQELSAAIIQKAFRSYLQNKIKPHEVDNKNDLVENPVDNPSTDTKGNKNINDKTEINNNSDNHSSETVDEGNDFVTGSEVVQSDTDPLEKPRLRSKEASEELAATIIQKAFRSYLQNKNKPHELELFGNEVGNFESNANETEVDNKNDLVKNPVDKPSTDTIENMTGNDETEKKNNSENQGSETVDKENDDSTGSEVDKLIQNDDDALEKPSGNRHKRLRSKEASQELAAAIIQKAFRSYLQIKNKPNELELLSNDNKNDHVENSVDNPTTDTIENINGNDETEKINNSEKQMSETIDILNDYVTGSEIIIQPDTDALEKPSENHHNILRSKEASQELAATIIQKAFRSYSQIKNKPHELELLSNEVEYFEPTAPKEDDLNSYSSSTINSTKSYRTSEEQAARVIQKAFRKFLQRKDEHTPIEDDTSSDQTTKWFVGDEPIIPNETLLRSPSEISFDETEAYVELKDSPQYSVDLSSNLDKSDANNLSRSPTAPVSNRSSSSVDLSYINNQTNLSEETVSVVGSGIKAVQLMHKNQEHLDVIQKESSNNGNSLNQSSEINENQSSNKNLEIAELHNLTGQFINSERHYSDVVNESNPSITKALQGIPYKPIDFTDFMDSKKELDDSKIPYEILEEPCIKKTLSKPLITTDSNDEAINAEDVSTSSDVDNDTEDSISMKTVKLHDPEEAIEKMKQRRDSTTKISNLEKPKDYSFDEPLVQPIDNLDTDEDGIVVSKLKREETRESSAQSEEDVVFGKESQTLNFYETIDFDTQFPAKGSLKRVHTIAGDIDAKSLLKNVTIDESIKYIEPPDFEVNSGSFCLDDATSQNIRRNMMAYSLSEADSDCFDKNLNNLNNSSLESKSQKYDDFNVSTALIDNGDTSTETESTIVSAVTKIQAGARGYLTRKRLGRTSNTSDQKSMAQEEISKASFGNAAISESLEHLVQEAAAKRIQKVYRMYYRQKLAEINQQNETISPELTTSMESSLAQKRSIMLQRGDALRNDSTPDEGNSSSNGSDDQKAKIKITDENKEIVVNILQTEVKSNDENQSLAQAKMTAADIRANKIEENKKRWLAMRQNSMPVQIDSEVLRVIPKHMRKKIKSAEGEKKKRNGRRRVLNKD